MNEVRDATSAPILEGLGAEPLPALRVAARAWLWFADGAILDWLEHRDLTRAALRDLLLRTLAGAIAAAGAPDLVSRTRELSGREPGRGPRSADD